MFDVSVVRFFQTLYFGSVLDETNTKPATEGIRTINKLLATDERVEINFIKVGDGTTLCRKK